MTRKLSTFDDKTTGRIGEVVKWVDNQRKRLETADYGTRTRSSPAPAPTAGIIPVNVVKDDGDAGNATASCTFTYTVIALGGGTLGTTMTPAMQRPAIGMTEPGVIGMGYDNGEGFILQWVDEVPDRVKRAC